MITAPIARRTTVRNILRKRIYVALQTKKSPFTAQEVVSRNAAVRAVAGYTTLYFDRSVFENVRPALLHMAANTRFETGLH